MSAWVGKEIRSDAPAVFDGAPITVSPKLASGAEKGYLVVTNEAGTTVDRRLLGNRPGNMVWDGLNSNGETFEVGTYRFAVESHGGGEVVSIDPVEIYATVDEAQIVDGEVVLVLQGGQSVSATSVSALRNAKGLSVPGSS